MSEKLVVVGLGYVGLPLAREALRAGMSVTGLDINHDLVSNLQAGYSHVDDVHHGEIAAMLADGFAATSDAAVLASAEVIVVCVPTPLSPDRCPDLGAIVAAADTIGANLARGTLVVFESTTFPGTTEEIIRPVLEATSGLTAGEEFSLAFSPERLDPGNRMYGLTNTPKIVGGFTPNCAARAADFYGRFVETVVLAKGCREAETAKLLENTYRHINIALVNEMARFCHELEIDLWEVIRLAATKPFGFQAFYPGPGVGGHCIPIDPTYLGHAVRSRLGYPFRFVELAEDINAEMPAYVARRAQAILHADGMALGGAEILLLGVTYKANVRDQRESPAVPLAEHLRRHGARVSYHDPYVPTWLDLTGAADLCVAAREADLVILLQAHDAYDADAIAAAATRFFDTRGVVTVPRAHRL